MTDGTIQIRLAKLREAIYGARAASYPKWVTDAALRVLGLDEKHPATCRFPECRCERPECDVTDRSAS